MNSDVSELLTGRVCARFIVFYLYFDNQDIKHLFIHRIKCTLDKVHIERCNIHSPSVYCRSFNC